MEIVNEPPRNENDTMSNAIKHRLVIDWASDAISYASSDHEIIRDVAVCARKYWHYPLRDNNLIVNVLDAHGPAGGWPCIEVVGPDDKLLRFAQLYDAAGCKPRDAEEYRDWLEPIAG